MAETYGSADAAERWSLDMHPATVDPNDPANVSTSGMNQTFGSADAAAQYYQSPAQAASLSMQQMVTQAVNDAFAKHQAEQASAGAPVTAKPPLTPAEQRAYVVKNFPLLAPLLNDPEVGPILLQAAADGITDVNMLYGRLSGTKWWQTTADTARKYDLTKMSDPATAANNVAQMKANLQVAANKAGIVIGNLDQAAEQATRMGWTADQVQLFIDHAAATGAKPTGGGDYATFLGQVKDLAGQYLMPISQATAQDYATRMLSGNLNLDGVKAIYTQQAGNQYPYLAPLMKDNPALTPRAYFKPIQDTVAQTLEVAPDQVDPLNPKWSGMLQITDPKTGQVRASTLTEAATAARKDPQWWGTQNAADTWSSAAQAVTKQLGY